MLQEDQAKNRQDWDNAHGRFSLTWKEEEFRGDDAKAKTGKEQP
jgi:hypothetical protein